MRHVKRLTTLLAAAMLALGLGITTAAAHAYLDHASPLVGSTVSTAPSEVRMWFTQALEPRFSGAQMRGPGGKVFGSGVVDGGDPKQMVIRVHGLAPGKYTVTWKILSVDTHRTEGSFSFEVKP
jgi:methionine-rich copper-binding protein CopC